MHSSWKQVRLSVRPSVRPTLSFLPPFSLYECTGGQLGRTKNNFNRSRNYGKKGEKNIFSTKFYLYNFGGKLTVVIFELCSASSATFLIWYLYACMHDVQYGIKKLIPSFFPSFLPAAKCFFPKDTSEPSCFNVARIHKDTQTDRPVCMPVHLWIDDS